jgi:hypothetical protein
MVDMKDLKSFEQKRSCGFDSHLWYIVMIRKRMTEQTLCMKWKQLKLVQRSEFDTNRTDITTLFAGVAE